MRITGSTRVLFCIADPVEQVRAPEVFNEVFARHGVDAVMVPLRVRPDQFAATLRALFESETFGGISLSIPHKVAALDVVDQVFPAARAARAINAIRRSDAGVIQGELFDGLGFVRGLDRAGIAYRGKRALLIGAGGAAAALATALSAGGAQEIAFFDLDGAKADRLAALLRQDGVPAQRAPSADPAGYDLIVNASPAGLGKTDPAPVDVDAIPAHAAVCDILMKNQPTALLRGALARGLAAQPGFEMLIQQTPAYLDFFGYPELAEALRRDDAYLRELLVPPGLRGA